jgi:streptomycin 6-kinase
LKRKDAKNAKKPDKELQHSFARLMAAREELIELSCGHFLVSETGGSEVQKLLYKKAVPEIDMAIADLISCLHGEGRIEILARADED